MNSIRIPIRFILSLAVMFSLCLGLIPARSAQAGLDCGSRKEVE